MEVLAATGGACRPRSNGAQGSTGRGALRGESAAVLNIEARTAGYEPAQGALWYGPAEAR